MGTKGSQSTGNQVDDFAKWMEKLEVFIKLEEARKSANQFAEEYEQIMAAQELMKDV